MPNLTPQEIQQRQEYTEKLKTRTLTRDEAEKLKQLLEKESAQARLIRRYSISIGNSSFARFGNSIFS